MSCYFRHMKGVFEEIGVEVTAENKKKIDAILHKIVDVEYKDCPQAWRSVKDLLADDKSRARLIKKLQAAIRA